MFYQLSHIAASDYFKKEYGENFCYPPHLHQCFEIIIVLSGEMSVTIDTTVYTLKQNDSVLIFPNQIHSLKSEISEHMLCIFSPKIIQAFTTKNTSKVPANSKFKLKPETVELIKNLENTSDKLLTKGVLYIMSAEFDENREYKTLESTEHDLISKIFQFIEQNYSDDCTLEDLEKETGYCYSYLSRCFKKAVGISYSNFVNIYRLNKACYLLENTNKSIIECATDSGFASIRNFNRKFKEQFSITPTEYKNNYKSTKNTNIHF